MRLFCRIFKSAVCANNPPVTANCDSPLCTRGPAGVCTALTFIYTVHYSENQISFQSVFSACKSCNAALIAAITKSVKVQFFPRIACSMPSTKLLGMRIVLFVVGGISGILNVAILVSSKAIIIIYYSFESDRKICYKLCYITC